MSMSATLPDDRLSVDDNSVCSVEFDAKAEPRLIPKQQLKHTKNCAFNYTLDRDTADPDCAVLRAFFRNTAWRDILNTLSDTERYFSARPSSVRILPWQPYGLADELSLPPNTVEGHSQSAAAFQGRPALLGERYKFHLGPGVTDGELDRWAKGFEQATREQFVVSDVQVPYNYVQPDKYDAALRAARARCVITAAGATRAELLQAVGLGMGSDKYAAKSAEGLLMPSLPCTSKRAEGKAQLKLTSIALPDTLNSLGPEQIASLGSKQPPIMNSDPERPSVPEPFISANKSLRPGGKSCLWYSLVKSEGEPGQWELTGWGTCFNEGQWRTILTRAMTYFSIDDEETRPGEGYTVLVPRHRPGMSNEQVNDWAKGFGADVLDALGTTPPKATGTDGARCEWVEPKRLGFAWNQLDAQSGVITPAWRARHDALRREFPAQSSLHSGHPDKLVMLTWSPRREENKWRPTLIARPDSLELATTTTSQAAATAAAADAGDAAPGEQRTPPSSRMNLFCSFKSIMKFRSDGSVYSAGIEVGGLLESGTPSDARRLQASLLGYTNPVGSVQLPADAATRPTDDTGRTVLEDVQDRVRACWKDICSGRDSIDGNDGQVRFVPWEEMGGLVSTPQSPASPLSSIDVAGESNELSPPLTYLALWSSRKQVLSALLARSGRAHPDEWDNWVQNEHVVASASADGKLGMQWYFD